MATKTQIQTAINSALPLKINKVKTIASLDVIVDEIYRTQLSDTQLTTNVVTRIPVGFSYNVVFKKTGNTVVFSGRLFNLTGFSVSNIDLMQITNTEFRPNGLSSTDLAFFCTNNLHLTLNPTNYIIRVNGTITAGSFATFNGTYTTI